MYKIKASASSANLGPGFDTLGLSLSMYNTVYFEANKNYVFVGFENQYCNPENNLIVSSYRCVLEKYQKKEQPLYLKIESDIPNSRGLGSSSSLICAGLEIANTIYSLGLTIDEKLTLANEIEGHPDNTSSCLLGGLVSSILVDGKVKAIKYNVNESYKFLVLIPNFMQSTEEARKVLPDKLSYSDIVYSSSRLANIGYLLEHYQYELLYEVMKDKIHEPYRYPLIVGSEVVRNYCDVKHLPHCVSGSGSTILVVVNDENKDKVLQDFQKMNELKLWKKRIIACNSNPMEVNYEE